MILTLREYIELTYFDSEILIGFSYKFKKSDYHIRQRVVCNDGFSMSVQGNKGGYSTPRYFTTSYDDMEIGFTSEYDELLGDEYQDVYGYVEFDIIEKIVEKHGGINIEETTKDCTEPKLIKHLDRLKKLESL